MCVHGNAFEIGKYVLDYSDAITLVKWHVTSKNNYHAKMDIFSRKYDKDRVTRLLVPIIRIHFVHFFLLRLVFYKFILVKGLTQKNSLGLHNAGKFTTKG